MTTRVRVRRLALLVLAVATLASSSCGGRRFYPVRGSVFVDGKPGAGVTVVFYPQDDPDPHPVQPSAIVGADGSFVLRTYVVQDRTLKDGAPAGKYQVTCVWYPPDLQKYLTNAQGLPDKLHGRYGNPKTSGLRVGVQEQPNELQPFKLTADK